MSETDPYAPRPVQPEQPEQPYGVPPYGSAQPQYQQPQYQQPQYGQPPYGYTPSRSTDGFAIASLVCAIAGLTFVPLIASIAALVLGPMSLIRLRTSGQGGRGLAIAGIVLGGIGLLAMLLLLVLAIAWVTASSPDSGFVATA